MERYYILRAIMIKKWISHIFLVSSLTFCLSLANLTNSTLNKQQMIILKFSQPENENALEYLKKDNISVRYKITPSTYILVSNGSRAVESILQHNTATTNEIIAIEPVRYYTNSLYPVVFCDGDIVTGAVDRNRRIEYGTDIQEAWSKGLSGKGVTIAITGAGLDKDHPDLKTKVKEDISFNFVDNNNYFMPASFQNINSYLSQSNKIAGLLVSNGHLCNTGIAYNASIVGIKIFNISLEQGIPPVFLTSSDIVARGLVHMHDDIDIFVNAWRPVNLFDPLDLGIKEAIKYGANKGRHGSGSVHIVPSGVSGNELTNSIYTITVNHVSRIGESHDATSVDTSVLTSANIASSGLVTGTLGNKCVENFAGLPAAVAQVAGIIALGLEANPRLTLRDVQKLVVQASELTSVHDHSRVKINGAGRQYHDYLGFGLLNANKFVTLAEKWKQENRTHTKYIQTAIEPVFTQIEGSQTLIYKFCHSCDLNSDDTCLTTIEHVTLTVDFKEIPKKITMEVESPMGTKSMLLDLTRQQEELQIGTTTTAAQLVSVHFWDELAFGVWKLSVTTLNSANDFKINKVELTLHGTKNDSVASAKNIHTTNVCLNNENLYVTPGTTKGNMYTTSIAQNGNEEKKNVVIFVVIGIGAMVGIGLVCFIFMRGNTHIPVSTTLAAKQIRERQIEEGKAAVKPRIHYESLHLEIHRLVKRQESVCEAADEEGE